MLYWRHRFVCIKLCLCVLLCISLTGLTGMLVLMGNSVRSYPRRNTVTLPTPPPKVTPPKVILSWTPFSHNNYYLPGTLDGLGCSVNNCVTTNDHMLLNISDSIIFRWVDIDSKDMPQKASPGPKWVLFNYEPQPNVNWSQMIPIFSKMTWVATYRLDSDIVTPYGRYRRKASAVERSEVILTRDEFERKKAVVWLVSRCMTWGKREDFVNVLQNHIEVDVFGNCGVPAPCSAGNHVTRITCYEKLARNYKFYLSFENSVCKDYASEKAFLPLRAGLVPVVFGGANYSRVLPPNSFIDALAFQSPKELADYLLEVGRNFTLYQSYQKWRKHYEIVQSDTPDYHWLCELCRLLHEPEHHASVLDKYSFYDWWIGGGRCSAWKKIYPSATED